MKPNFKKLFSNKKVLMMVLAAAGALAAAALGGGLLFASFFSGAKDGAIAANGPEMVEEFSENIAKMASHALRELGEEAQKGQTGSAEFLLEIVAQNFPGMPVPTMADFSGKTRWNYAQNGDRGEAHDLRLAAAADASGLGLGEASLDAQAQLLFRNGGMFATLTKAQVQLPPIMDISGITELIESFLDVPIALTDASEGDELFRLLSPELLFAAARAVEQRQKELLIFLAPLPAQNGAYRVRVQLSGAALADITREVLGSQIPEDDLAALRDFSPEFIMARDPRFGGEQIVQASEGGPFVSWSWRKGALLAWPSQGLEISAKLGFWKQLRLSAKLQAGEESVQIFSGHVGAKSGSVTLRDPLGQADQLVVEYSNKGGKLFGRVEEKVFGYSATFADVLVASQDGQCLSGRMEIFGPAMDKNAQPIATLNLSCSWQKEPAEGFVLPATPQGALPLGAMFFPGFSDAQSASADAVADLSADLPAPNP